MPDDQQRTSRLQFKTPEGLLGMITKVPLCPNAQAEANACPEASQIGHTVVASGPGPYPLVVPQPGQPPAPIYLTGRYEGAPYGLSIVVPIHVGPFTLKTQSCRAKIEVDPLTSQLTVTTDPLPQYVAGVPTDLRTINAVIDRPGFMFNPTDCGPRRSRGPRPAPKARGADLEPLPDGLLPSADVQAELQGLDQWQDLGADGASLKAKIVYPTGELGANQASSQTNIAASRSNCPSSCLRGSRRCRRPARRRVQH